jgi:uncharacterized protein involved in response to NO
MRSERAPLKSWLLAILAIGYVFVAAGYLTLGLNAFPNSVASSILYALYPFLGFAVILAPIAIREGRSQKRLGRLALQYVGLMYVGILRSYLASSSSQLFRVCGLIWASEYTGDPDHLGVCENVGRLPASGHLDLKIERAVLDDAQQIIFAEPSYE